MKTWPDQSKTVQFTDLTDPICEAIRFAYDLKRKHQNKDIPYKGYDIGKVTGCYQPDENLTQESLEYQDENQDRDALQVIVGIAVQLGIEQGRRQLLKSQETKMTLARMSAKIVVDALGEG